MRLMPFVSAVALAAVLTGCTSTETPQAARPAADAAAAQSSSGQSSQSDQSVGTPSDPAASSAPNGEGPQESPPTLDAIERLTQNGVANPKTKVPGATLAAWSRVWEGREATRSKVLAANRTSLCLTVDGGWLLMQGLGVDATPDVIGFGAFAPGERQHGNCTLEETLLVVDVDTAQVFRGPNLFKQMKRAGRSLRGED